MSKDTLLTEVINLPDSISYQMPDVHFVIDQQPSTTFWGLTPEWGAIVFPTIATILVFVLGLFINWLHNRSKEKREMKQYRDSIYVWIDQLTPCVNSQVEKIRDFAMKISKSASIQGERFEFSLTIADQMDFISAEKLLKYFVLQSGDKKCEEFAMQAYNMVSSITYLSKTQYDVIQTYEKCSGEYRQLMAPWNEKIINLQAVLEKGHITAEERSIYQTLRGIILKWQKIAHQEMELNMESTYENLISPILSSFPGYTIGRADYETTDAIIQDARDLNLIYISWKKLNEGYEKIFLELADNIEKSCQILNSAKSYFKENI